MLDTLNNPDAVTLAKLLEKASSDIGEWLADRKNRRAIPHRLERCGYAPVRNDYTDDGLFKVGGKRQVIYARSALTLSERLKAARALTKSV